MSRRPLSTRARVLQLLRVLLLLLSLGVVLFALLDSGYADATPTNIMPGHSPVRAVLGTRC